MPLDEQKKLETISQYFQEIIAPQATRIDQYPDALQNAIKGMGNRQLLGLKIPQSWGGEGLTDIAYCQYQVMISRYSGALAFLQTQHQSAGGKIAASKNHQLQKAYLPQMSNGLTLVGVAFSQLRRQGKPLIKAIPVAQGYMLQGEIPWITGFGFFHHFILGAIDPDGKEIYSIVPFINTPEIEFSQPMDLVAMKATNTVSAVVKGLLVEKDSIVNIEEVDSIHNRDIKNVLDHGFYALGCAYGALDIIEATYQKKQLPFLKQAYNALHQELTHCSKAMFEAIDSPDATFENKLKLRSQIITLAGKCAQAAVVVSSGVANYQNHPAGRIYREALMFTVFGQTTSVMEATLNSLSSNKL